MTESYLYVGLDTHKRSTHSAALIDGGEDVYEERKLSWKPERVVSHLLKLQEKHGRPLHVCYEAGVCGFVLQRLLEEGR